MSKLSTNKITNIPTSLQPNGAGIAVTSTDFISVPDDLAVTDGDTKTVTGNDLTSVLKQMKNIGIDYETVAKETFDTWVKEPATHPGRKGVIYLVYSDSEDDKEKSGKIDYFTEYIWDNQDGLYELLGDASVNLSDYVKNDTDYQLWQSTVVTNDTFNKEVSRLDEKTDYIPVNYFMYEPYIYENNGYFDTEKKAKITHSSDFVHQNCITLTSDMGSIRFRGNNLNSTHLTEINDQYFVLSFFVRNANSGSKSNPALSIMNMASIQNQEVGTLINESLTDNITPEWKRLSLVGKNRLITVKEFFNGSLVMLSLRGASSDDRIELADIQLEPGSVLHPYHISPFDETYVLERTGVYKGQYIDLTKAQKDSKSLFVTTNDKTQINSDFLPAQQTITVDTALSSTSENPVQNKAVYNNVTFNASGVLDSKTTTVSVGGISKGTKYQDLKNKSLKDIIKSMLFPVIQPSGWQDAKFYSTAAPKNEINYGQTLPAHNTFTFSFENPYYTLDGVKIQCAGKWTHSDGTTALTSDNVDILLDGEAFSTPIATKSTYSYQMNGYFTANASQFRKDSDGKTVGEAYSTQTKTFSLPFTIKTKYPVYLTWVDTTASTPSIDLTSVTPDWYFTGGQSISKKYGIRKVGELPVLVVPLGSGVTANMSSANTIGTDYLTPEKSTYTVTGWNYDGLAYDVYVFHKNGYSPNGVTLSTTFTINHE